MSEEEKKEEVKKYKFLCTKTCFRGNAYFRKNKDYLHTSDPRPPKHFKGYNPDNDPDAPKDEAKEDPKKTTCKAADKKAAAPKKESGQANLPGTEG